MSKENETHPGPIWKLGKFFIIFPTYGRISADVIYSGHTIIRSISAKYKERGRKVESPPTHKRTHVKTTYAVPSYFMIITKFSA